MPAKNQYFPQNKEIDKELTQTTLPEDNKLIQYLYDKEIERSKLIVEKTSAAFFIFAADGGYLALRWKDLFPDSNEKNLMQKFIVLTLIALTILFGVVSFGFTTKINESDKHTDTFDIKAYYSYLHEMNGRKENLLRFAYLALSFSVFFLIIANLS